MMTLGEATEVYRKRQEDLDTTIDEMSSLKESISKGHCGRVNISVLEMKQFTRDATISIKIHDVYVATNKMLCEHIEFLLNERDTNIQICINDIENEGDTAKFEYIAILPCSDIPHDREYKTELQITNTYTEAHIQIKASYDDLIEELASKEKQFEQLTEGLDEIQQKIKEIQHQQSAGSSSTTTTTSSKPKSTKKSKKSKTVTINESPPSSSPDESSLLNKTGEALGFVVALSIQQRAYILFGIAAIGIYMFGDNASV